MTEGKMFRINREELKVLERKTREINGKLISRNLNAMKDSELLHSILISAIKSIDINEQGKTYLSCEKEKD